MSTPLSETEISLALNELPGWELIEDALVKEVTLGSFRAAVGFIMRLAFEAEELDHHPEIFNVYKRLRLSLSTHDAGGKVTNKDLALAKRIEGLLASQ